MGGVISLFSFIYPEQFYNYPIWFLWCLFLVYILFYAIRLIATHFKNFSFALFTISFVIGLFGYMLGYFQWNLPAFLDTSMTALPFFAMGHLFAIYRENIMKSRLYKYWPLTLSLFVLIAVLLAGSGDPVFARNEYRQSFIELYGCGVSGIAIVLLIASKLPAIPFLSWFGRSTLVVLLVHRPLLEVVLKALLPYNLPEPLLALFTVTILIVLFFVIVPGMNRFFPYTTAHKNLFRYT